MIIINGAHKCPVCSNRAINYDSNENVSPNTLSIHCVKCSWEFEIFVNEVRELCRSDESWLGASIRIATERMQASCIPQAEVVRHQETWREQPGML